MSGRGEAVSRGNYTPLVTPRSLFSRPRQKANSLCVIFVMIQPVVGGGGGLSPLSLRTNRQGSLQFLLQLTLTAQISDTAVALHSLNCVVMSSCGEEVGRHLGSRWWWRWWWGRRGGEGCFSGRIQRQRGDAHQPRASITATSSGKQRGANTSAGVRAFHRRSQGHLEPKNDQAKKVT